MKEGPEHGPFVQGQKLHEKSIEICMSDIRLTTKKKMRQKFYCKPDMKLVVLNLLHTLFLQFLVL